MMIWEKISQQNKICCRRFAALAVAVIVFLGVLPAVRMAGAKAQSGTVMLKQMKEQTPERLTMTVTTEDGQSVLVDAPIILPGGETLPIVLCKRASFDTTDIRDHYPLAKGMASYEREASTAWDYAGSPIINVFIESKKDILRGKTDYSKRLPLPIGGLPPLNDYTVGQAIRFIYKNISLFQGDTALDFRPLRTLAMSGLHKVKSVKVKDMSTGVSWREIVADPEKPIIGSEKGLWQMKIAQYIHGIQLFENYLPYGRVLPLRNNNGWYTPMCYVQIMDEENCNIHIAALSEREICIEDASLLPFPVIESIIRKRIESGKLKSVFQLTLGYSTKIVQSDSFLNTNGHGWNMDARFVLVPEWQILGYDEKDCENASETGYALPSKEEILIPEMYGRDSFRYELRLNAQTGEPILDEAAMEYDLEKNR